MTNTRRGFLAAGGALAVTQLSSQLQSPASADVEAEGRHPGELFSGGQNGGSGLFGKKGRRGFTSSGSGRNPGSNLARDKASDAVIEKMREDVRQSGLYCSVLGVTANHIDPDPAKRQAVNDHMAGVIEVAGKLGVPHIGTMSGKDAANKARRPGG